MGRWSFFGVNSLSIVSDAEARARGLSSYIIKKAARPQDVFMKRTMARKSIKKRLGDGFLTAAEVWSTDFSGVADEMGYVEIGAAKIHRGMKDVGLPTAHFPRLDHQPFSKRIVAQNNGGFVAAAKCSALGFPRCGGFAYVNAWRAWTLFRGRTMEIEKLWPRDEKFLAGMAAERKILLSAATAGLNTTQMRKGQNTSRQYDPFRIRGANKWQAVLRKAAWFRNANKSNKTGKSGELKEDLHHVFVHRYFVGGAELSPIIYGANVPKFVARSLDPQGIILQKNFVKLSDPTEIIGVSVDLAQPRSHGGNKTLQLLEAMETCWKETGCRAISEYRRIWSFWSMVRRRWWFLVVGARCW